MSWVDKVIFPRLEKIKIIAQEQYQLLIAGLITRLENNNYGPISWAEKIIFFPSPGIVNVLG